MIIPALQRYGIFAWHCEVSSDRIQAGGLLIEDLDAIDLDHPLELFETNRLPEKVGYIVILPHTVRSVNYNICLLRR